jgi:hypothetical protein
MRIAKNLYFLLTLIGLFSFSGCSSSSEPCTPIKTSGPIIPLAIGNEWIYRVTQYQDESGIIGFVHYDTMRVIRDSLIGGEKWYLMTDGWSTNRSDGLWGLYYVTPDSTIPVLLWKYPAKSGEVIRKLDDSIMVVSIDSAISIPYGCFLTNQYMVKIYNQELRSHFLTPG